MSRKALNSGSEKMLKREYSSLQEVLLYAAEHCPERGATYIDAGGKETFVSYPEMLTQAMTWLKSLQDRGIKPGDMLLAEIVEPKQYHRLFWACVFGGIVLAPIPQPATWELGSEAILTLERVWKKLDSPALIVQDIHRENVLSLKEEGFQGLECIVTDELLSDEPGVRYREQSGDMAYIQFSSGTTGDPKGAMLTYENIRCSCYSIAAGIQMGEDAPVFSWLPHTHNLGIFVPFVAAMMLTNKLYYMLPSTCIRNPLLFLQKISEHRGAWYCTNNFGIDWLTSQIPEEKLKNLDLSSLRGIFAGAENISKSVVEKFLDKFAICGLRGDVMRPGYGLAEGTVAVAITTREGGYEVQQISRGELMRSGRVVRADPENASDCMNLSGNGPPIGGITMRVADDDGNTVDEGIIGEVELQGKCVYKGYYGESEGLYSNVRDGWLQTGDLGFFKEGILYIAGRKKDVAIIRGVNYMLTDLEDMLYRKLGLPRGVLAVASVFNTQQQQEEMIVFAEHKDSLEKFIPWRRSIIQAVNEELSLNLQLVIPVEAIKKTSSGKIQRLGMKMQYESGQYADVEAKIRRLVGKENLSQTHLNETENETQSIIRKCWAKALKLPEGEISVDESFSALGGQSVQAYWLLGILAKEFEIELDHEIIVLCKTIREMESYIEERRAEAGREAECEDKSLQKDTKRQVAITGLAFRLPGAKTQEEFWSNLTGKKDSISKVSSVRRDLAGEPSWDNWMGEIDDIDSFDHDFFDIKEEEAEFMDPQQRVLLEVTHEALADAGIITDDMDEEKRAGVYTGVGVNSYFPMVIDYMRENGMRDVDPKTALGNMANIAGARISHQYNFVGPVMAIDTACSSFLTALHYAAKAVEEGSITGAVVTGSNIMPSSHIYALLSKAGIISSTNRSKVFDKDADGSILGEGVVVVYIESLRHAIDKSKHIYGLVRGSAVNNDGFALSVMAPNPRGQHNVLRQAYRDAGVDPGDISYFEAHGTGTKIGDPIEISALSKLCEGVGVGNGIPVGSVKTNIGHLLWAAGGAGLVKVLLCMKYGLLVPSLHADNVNPLLQMDKSPFRVISETEEWKAPEGKKRLAGITSLGLGGTNAHVIIEEWNAPAGAYTPGKRHVLALSAKTKKALIRTIENTKSFVESTEGSCVADLCYTSGRCRKHYEYRAACILTEGEASFGEIKMGKKDSAKRRGIEIDWDDVFGRAEGGTDIKDILDKVMELYLLGADIPWELVYPDGSGRMISIPAYPFERNSVWLKNRHLSA